MLGYVIHWLDHCFEISMTLNLFLTMAVVMGMTLSSVLKFDWVSSSQGAGSDKQRQNIHCMKTHSHFFIRLS